MKGEDERNVSRELPKLKPRIRQSPPRTPCRGILGNTNHRAKRKLSSGASQSTWRFLKLDVDLLTFSDDVDGEGIVTVRSVTLLTGYLPSVVRESFKSRYTDEVVSRATRSMGKRIFPLAHGGRSVCHSADDLVTAKPEDGKRRRWLAAKGRSTVQDSCLVSRPVSRRRSCSGLLGRMHFDRSPSSEDV